MPLADGAGGGKKKGGGRKPIVVFNPVTSATTTVTGQAPATGGGGTKPLGAPKGGGTSSSSKSGSGSASSSASSAATDYTKQQRARDTAARDRYVEDAENMGGQVAALRAALGMDTKKKLDGTFRQALNQRLQNVKLVRNEQMDLLKDGFADRSASLDADEKNNEIAMGDSSGLNTSNMLRERMSAVTEAMSQGAGESDTMRAQMMSLRNWDANQDGINRAFADGQRSIANSRNDLLVDTRTGLNNVWSESNADREQLWTNFYNQRSESQTQLGNVLGQQAEYYGLAAEANQNAGGPGAKTTTSSSSSSTSKSSKSSKGTDKKGKGRTATVLGGPKAGATASASAEFEGRATPPAVLGVGGPDGGRPTADKGRVPRDWDKGKDLGKPKRGRPGKEANRALTGSMRDRQDAAAAASDKVFMQASKTQGKVWENPGTPEWLKEWGPQAKAPAPVANSVLVDNVSGTRAMKAPEGATLRKW